MRPPGLGVAAEQCGFAGLEEDDGRRERFSDLLQDGGKALQHLAFADVDDQRGAIDLGGLADEIGEAGQKFERKVVDGVVAKVFKGLERRGFAGAGESGENDEFAGASRVWVLGLGPRARFGGPGVFAGFGFALVWNGFAGHGSC